MRQPERGRQISRAVMQSVANEEVITMTDFQGRHIPTGWYDAFTLFQCGWRSADRCDLIEEMGLTEHEADVMCAELDAIEEAF